MAPTHLPQTPVRPRASQELEFWLKFLERIEQEDLDPRDRALCSLYISNLRRKLGIHTEQAKETIRKQTRHRFRERRRNSGKRRFQ